MIARAQSPKKSYSEGSLEMASLSTTAHVCHGSGSVELHYGFQSGCYFSQGLIPGDALEPLLDPFEGIKQSIRVVMMVEDIKPLSTSIALASGIVLVWTHP